MKAGAGRIALGVGWGDRRVRRVSMSHYIILYTSIKQTNLIAVLNNSIIHTPNPPILVMMQSETYNNSLLQRMWTVYVK